jgi:hypothetical protein
LNVNVPSLANSLPERNDDDTHDDTWQPVSLALRRAAREFGLPIATAIAAFEANGLNVEAD